MHRRDQERLRAVERKAAGHARDAIAKAERTVSRNRRMPNGLIRDAVLAVILAIIIAAFWKPMMLILTVVAVP